MWKTTVLCVSACVLSSCGIVTVTGNPDRLPSQPSTPVPAAAPVPQAPPEVRLVAAIERQGCVLNGDNVGRILLAANMTQEELTRTMNRLEELGRVETVGSGGIRVLTDQCA